MAAAIVVIGGGIALAVIYSKPNSASSSGSGSAQDSSAPKSSSTPAPAGGATQATSSGTADASSEMQTMEVAHAVMVTVELDFGGKVPTIAQALQQVERGYKPDDGVGRTFAILDAYGEPTPDGKLHMSMHVSSEKPGIASLTFRPTGEVLWQSRILPGKPVTAADKRLTILFDDGKGKTFTVDGSNNPGSVLDASVKELSVPVKSVWQDGQELEFTFIYSACGCPVKAKVKRVGDRTERVGELPVMFPDDPAAMNLISRLMRWP